MKTDADAQVREQLSRALRRMYTELDQTGRAAGLADHALASHVAEAGILVVLCHSTGRLGEVDKVTAEDLRPDGFVVRGPTGSRMVHVDDEGLELLRRQAALVGGTGRLFPVCAPSRVHRAFRRVGGGQGAGRLGGPHVLRQMRGRQEFRRIRGARSS